MPAEDSRHRLLFAAYRRELLNQSTSFSNHTYDLHLFISDFDNCTIYIFVLVAHLDGWFKKFLKTNDVDIYTMGMPITLIFLTSTSFFSFSRNTFLLLSSI